MRLQVITFSTALLTVVLVWLAKSLFKVRNLANLTLDDFSWLLGSANN
jgi:hypothetical protein